jgi:hypothetical protein
VNTVVGTPWLWRIICIDGEGWGRTIRRGTNLFERIGICEGVVGLNVATHDGLGHGDGRANDRQDHIRQPRCAARRGGVLQEGILARAVLSTRCVRRARQCWGSRGWRVPSKGRDSTEGGEFRDGMLGRA